MRYIESLALTLRDDFGFGFSGDHWFAEFDRAVQRHSIVWLTFIARTVKCWMKHEPRE